MDNKNIYKILLPKEKALLIKIILKDIIIHQTYLIELYVKYVEGLHQCKTYTDIIKLCYANKYLIN